MYVLIERLFERVRQRPTPDRFRSHWLESWWGRTIVDSFLIVLILAVVWLENDWPGPF